MQTEILDQFDTARAKAAGERLRPRSAGIGQLIRSVLWIVVIALMVGRYALAARSSTLQQEAQQAQKGVLHHEALRLRIEAVWYARTALWPFLFAAERAAYATHLASLAKGYYNVGDLQRAIAFEREAERFAQSAGDNELLAQIRISQASLRLALDPDGAKQAYLEALDLYERERDLSADPSIHLRLADCALAGRDFAGALAEVEKAAAIAPADYDVAMKKVEVLTSLGRDADALTIFNPTLLPQIGRPALPEPQYTSRRYDWNFALSAGGSDAYPRIGADLALRLGLAKEAETFVWGLKPVVGSEIMQSPDVIAEYYARVGWLREVQKKPAEAVEYFLRAIQWLEEYRNRLPDELRAHFFAKDVFTLPYRHLAAALGQLPAGAEPVPAVRTFGRTNLEAAVYFAEATKARAFMEQVASRGRGAAGALSEEFATQEEARIAERRARQQGLEEAIAKGGFTPLTMTKTGWKVADPSSAVIEAQRRLVEANHAWQLFEDELYRRFPRYAALKYPRPVPLSEVPIADDEVVLEYALSDRESVLFLLEGKTRREVIILPVGASRVREMVADYLAPIREGGASPKEDLGPVLFDTLLAPALARISPGRRLIIVPDGVLWTLPFEILPAGRGATRVSDAWSITYSPSLAILALNRLTSAPQPTEPFFGLGDVAFGSESAGKTGGRLALRGIYIDRAQYVFPPLPETRREVEQAAQRFGVRAAPPDVLFGDEATETHLKRTALVRYRILHLATHGVANNDLANVREPALLLARDAENDGVLRASEVTNLSLGASIVVLAACKTGLGEDLGGEGVMSIARAFQHGGARTVVMSLWNVPSEVTETLFATFYRELQSGKGVAESLRAARQDVRRRHPEPFYWGAFTIVGEGQ